MPIAIIAPDDGVFGDCEAVSDKHCPGVHYVNRSLPDVQDILNTLKTNGTCSNLGPINVTTLGIDCTTPINLPQTPVLTPSTNPTQENSNINNNGKLYITYAERWKPIFTYTYTMHMLLHSCRTGSVSGYSSCCVWHHISSCCHTVDKLSTETGKEKDSTSFS